MTVVRAAARATRRGAVANFTGEVFQDEVLVGQPPSRMRATVVSFTPGARTGRHAHPMIPPNTMHWHGAAPDRLFAHLAMSENGEQGQGTDWAEHVSDTEYTMQPAAD
jgi:quercetin dioxygenase-like cupin family protein